MENAVRIQGCILKLPKSFQIGNSRRANIPTTQASHILLALLVLPWVKESQFHPKCQLKVLVRNPEYPLPARLCRPWSHAAQTRSSVEYLNWQLQPFHWNPFHMQHEVTPHEDIRWSWGRTMDLAIKPMPSWKSKSKHFPFLAERVHLHPLIKTSSLLHLLASGCWHRQALQVHVCCHV